MARLRRNNESGTITDNPLTIGATTINSAGFATLPVVSAPDTLILILDPQEVGGAAEIVIVTTHTNASTAVTVTRGQEGSVARSHVFNTTWMHGPIVSDFTEAVTSSTRPATVYEGDEIYETDTDRFMGHTGSAWQQQGLFFDPPACRVYNTVDQNVLSGTLTALTFNTERYDTDNMHSTGVNTSRITFNTAGIYNITAVAAFSNNATGKRSISIRLNGTTYIADQQAMTLTMGDAHILTVTCMWKASAADYVEAVAYQTSGATLTSLGSTATNADLTEFSATWLGRGN